MVSYKSILNLRQRVRFFFAKVSRNRKAALRFLLAFIVVGLIVQFVVFLGDERPPLDNTGLETFTVKANAPPTITNDAFPTTHSSTEPQTPPPSSSTTTGTPPPAVVHKFTDPSTLPPPPPAGQKPSSIPSLPARPPTTTAAPRVQRRVRHAVAFSVDEADAEAVAVADGDALPVPVRRAVPGEAHAIQREMLPYVADMLDHALHSYFTHAFPHDDLLSLTGGYRDSFSGVGVTLLDSLDMLALAGRPRTFRRAARWVESHLALATQDVDASAFEVNIRAMGGLVAAHYLYEEGVVPVVRGEHDYGGGLVRMARDLGNRLMHVFDSPTGLPFAQVNLQRGRANAGRTTTTNADAGTFVLEFMALSRLTGNATYAGAARRAAQVLHDMREPGTQMMNMYVDVVGGTWSSQRQTSIGACLDSTVEYAVKYHVLSGEVQEWREYEADRRAASAWLRRGGFYYTLSQSSRLQQEGITQGLSAFYPGNMVLGGHHAEAAEGVWATHGLMKPVGVLPEVTSLLSGTPTSGSYQLRPEHVESIYYLYRATHDPVYLEMGREFAVGLQLRTRVPYGFAVLAQSDGVYSRAQLTNHMESFLIAETLKYLYLLFDEASAVHAAPVGWVFTTEAHVVPNTWEHWGLDAASVRTGRRGGPVRPAYTAFMFNATAGGGGGNATEAAALVAEAAVVRERWVLKVSPPEPIVQQDGALTAEQMRERSAAAWGRRNGLVAQRHREVYERRAAHWAESVAAARRRHVEGLLCAARARLRRSRGSVEGRRRATVFRPHMRAVAAVCAASGPELHSALVREAGPPFAAAAAVNPVHRHYSDAVSQGAYDYHCDIGHLRGVRQLSRGVYHPALTPSGY